MSEASYNDKIAEEALHWSKITDSLCKSGLIPYDLDRSKAQQITDRALLDALGGRRSDPLAEETWMGEYIEKIVCRVKEKRSPSILEIGCGAGWLSIELAKTGAKRVDAIDVSVSRIQTAKDYLSRHYPSLSSKINYQVLDINKEPLPSRDYDFIVSFNSLHHLVNIVDFFSRANKCLNKDGLLLAVETIEERASVPAKLLKSFLLFFIIFLPAYFSLRRRFANAAKPVIELVLPEKWYHKTSVSYWSREKVGKSPFEGATGEELISAARKHFRIIDFESANPINLNHSLNFRMKESTRKMLYHILSKVENAVCSERLMKGQTIFIEAARRS